MAGWTRASGWHSRHHDNIMQVSSWKRIQLCRVYPKQRLPSSGGRGGGHVMEGVLTMLYHGLPDISTLIQTLKTEEIQRRALEGQLFAVDKPFGYSKAPGLSDEQRARKITRLKYLILIGNASACRPCTTPCHSHFSLTPPPPTSFVYRYLQIFRSTRCMARHVSLYVPLPQHDDGKTHL